MQSVWNDTEAARCATDLDLRVYTSRLLGGEPSLVLHGGGNTSVKTIENAEQTLCVKGSGADLALVTASDFTPVRLEAVKRLITLTDLDNDGLMAAVSTCVAESDRPRPSIETLLHAVLPYKFVEHTHADSVLALTNTANGARIAAEVFGPLAPLVPFRHSGFALAKACHEVFTTQATADAIGLILLHHGVFAFGHTARESYENMIRLVTLAEQYLQRHGAWRLPTDAAPVRWTLAEIARLRRDMSHTAGFPLVLKLQDSAESRAFARRRDLPTLCGEGPATPQHAVFAKRLPMIGRDVRRYADDYVAYVASYRPGNSLASLRLDAAPRVVIDADFGIWTAGMDAHHARITGEIFQHDMEIMTRASAHDRYAGLSPADVLDAEIHYGGFEWRKRQSQSDAIALLGEVVLVAGPATAFGRTIARALLARGAAVGVAGGESQTDSDAELCLNESDPESALRTLVGRFGGLDVLVLRPGFETWLAVCAEVLGAAPYGGRVVLIGPAAWCERMRKGCEAHALAMRTFGLALEPESNEDSIAENVARLCTLNFKMGES
jgi:rhamnose utilization protein RhaD (predicted bifunctional aldolase and dehydrogenase)